MKCIICGEQSSNWAALYLRLSEDKAIIDDEGNRVLAGENVDDQKNKLSAMAHRDGFHISDIYNDNDKVASDPDNKPRPEFLRMLSEASNGSWSRIYIRHMDRLYRTPEDLGALAKAFQPNEITVHQEWGGHPLDLTKPMGYLVAGIMAAVAKYETDHKRMRQIAMNEVRMLRGEMYSGVHPFGWNKDNVTLNEPEAKIIRDATKHVLNGGSIASEYKRLNSAGIKSPRGGKWDGAALRQVLERPANAGIVTYKGKTIAVEAQWTPIISKADYFELKRILDGRKGGEPKDAKYLLTGMVTCGECGSACYCTYTQQTKKGKTYRYDFYQCNGPKKCASVSKKALEEYVVDYFLNLGEVMTQSFRKVQTGVDLEAISARRLEIAARFVEKGADHEALSQELRELDNQEDKVTLRLVPSTQPVTTAYLWSLVKDDVSKARNELGQHLQVTIHKGGKGRIPIAQKVTVTEKGTATNALDMNMVITAEPFDLL